jgi:hypothetical protein
MNIWDLWRNDIVSFYITPVTPVFCEEFLSTIYCVGQGQKEKATLIWRNDIKSSSTVQGQKRKEEYKNWKLSLNLRRNIINAKC